MKRLIFYASYSLLVVLAYFLLSLSSEQGTLVGFLFLASTLIGQFFLSSIPLKISVVKRVFLTIPVWVISYILAVYVRVQFLFNNTNDLSDLYAFMAFMLSVIVCYESFFGIRKK